MTDPTEAVVIIKVKPLDKSAKGGFRLHQQVRGFILRATEAQKASEALQALPADANIAAQKATAALQSLATDAEIEAWVLKRLSTVDGSPLEDALDEISYDEYLQLFQAALGGSSIDPLTTGSSTPPAVAAAPSLPGS